MADRPPITADEPPPPYSKTPMPSHKARNGIPPSARRSMEDEARPVPDGWVRQFDTKHAHQYYVDTRASPPRSIWHHPYDDEQYLSTLSSEERERIQALYKVPSHADIEAESTDEEDHAGPSHKPGAAPPSRLDGHNSETHDAYAASSSSSTAKPSFGRKVKDKITSSTHEEREARRRERAEQERKAYQQHMAFRNAMVRAMETGTPQLVGKDRDGHDLYIEPPSGPRNTVYGYPGGRPPNYRGYNPYSAGVYQDPNARFLRPQGAYGRPYGMGYGGGYGLPLAGGLAGGLLMGGMLGGF